MTKFEVKKDRRARRTASRSGLIDIGLRIREERKRHQLTLDALATRAGLSKGLLSRIENFRAVPSLPVLADIARSLEVDMGELVRGIGAADNSDYLLMRAGRGRVLEREKSIGFHYTSIFSRTLAGSHMEMFDLRLEPGAKRKLLTTNGEQIVYGVAGAVDFKLGARSIRLNPGDALFFNGRIPHAPANPGRRPAQLLALYFLEN